MTIRLDASLAAWDTPEFAATFKREFESIDPAVLPLQQGLRYTSAVADEAFHVLLMATHASVDALTLKIGVVYAGLIAGCNCADDPTPPVTQTEYCVLHVRIDRVSGQARVELTPED